MPRRASREAGFIVTLEMIIIFTILGIGLLAGIFAVRNALFVWLVKQKAQTVWVYDGSGVPLGPARDFDEHEAPRLFYIDRDVSYGKATSNYRAFVGVRDDRFTSRHRIFYTNSTDCGLSSLGGPVIACIVRAGNEDGDNRAIGIVGVETVDGGGGTASGTGQIANAGGIGYLYPLQPGGSNYSGPAYGIGRDLDSGNLPGWLYRECDDPAIVGDNGVCDCDPADVRSVWTSQTVTSGDPCEPLPGGVTVEAAKCPDGRAGDFPGDLCLNPADSRCVTVGGGGAGTCSNFGAACSAGAACNFCSGDPLTPCTPLGGTECNTGRCNDLASTQCGTNADCPNTPGTCSITDDLCVSNAQCTGVCELDNNVSCSRNQDCNPPGPGDLGDCLTQTCDGAQVYTCSNGLGTCDDGTCITGGSLVCACPAGWIDYGANCCPPGTVQATPGQCTLGNNGDVVEAIAVTRFNGVDWSTPFRVNLPPDPADFTLREPSGTEGVPGTDTDIPYTGTDFVFDRAPDGEGVVP